MISAAIAETSNTLNATESNTASNDQNLCENVEIECNNNTSKCAVENDNDNSYSIKDANESASGAHSKATKEELINNASERKKGSKKNWIMEYLRQNH